METVQLVNELKVCCACYLLSVADRFVSDALLSVVLHSVALSMNLKFEICIVSYDIAIEIQIF